MIVVTTKGMKNGKIADSKLKILGLKMPLNDFAEAINYNIADLIKCSYNFYLFMAFYA